MNAFLEEIHGQVKALEDTFAALNRSQALKGAADEWKSGKYSSIVLTGMGSSDFIARAGALLLRGKGIPAASFNAGELLHYGGRDYSKTLTVCISQSGESYEIVKLLPSLGTVTAICNDKDSTLGKRADHLLLTKAGKEEMTSTKTFVTCWQAMLMLAGAITGETTVLGEEGDLAAKALETGLGDIVEFIGDNPALEMTARGVSVCAASQSALMWMEAAHRSATAMTGGNFRHGPLEMVKDGMVVFIFTHSRSVTWPQSLRLARDVLSYGGKVVMLTDSPVPLRSDRLRVFAVPCPCEELSPITNIIPMQLTVNAWAERHGMTPGDFSHGAKVTTKE